MQTKRLYNNKDVEMLVTIATIIENAITNQAFLQTKRTNYTLPFFQNLKDQIETTTNTYLGRDAARNMRQASQTVYTIQATAIKDLSEAKIQIQEDFKNSPVQQTEILTTLGFTAYHKKAQNNDQEALINLLFQFKNNLTPTLATEIVAQGTAQQTLDNIIAHANTLNAANIIQETNKSERTNITAETIQIFNQLYSQVISIAKISQNFYKDNKQKQAQFSYNKIAKTINGRLTTTS